MKFDRLGYMEVCSMEATFLLHSSSLTQSLLGLRFILIRVQERLGVFRVYDLGRS